MYKEVISFFFFFIKLYWRVDVVRSHIILLFLPKQI